MPSIYFRIFCPFLHHFWPFLQAWAARPSLFFLTLIDDIVLHPLQVCSLLICAVVHCYFRFFDHFWLIFALFAGMSRETFPFLVDPHRGHPPPLFPGVFLFLWPVVHYYFRFFPTIFGSFLPFLQAWAGKPPLSLLILIEDIFLHPFQVCSCSFALLFIITLAFFTIFGSFCPFCRHDQGDLPFYCWTS